MAARVFKASVTLLTFEQEAVATSALRLSPRRVRFLSQFVGLREGPARFRASRLHPCCSADFASDRRLEINPTDSGRTDD
jgi:hypothetical protein